MTDILSDLPPPGRLALLLDFDGTLVDIAPTPEGVVVAPGLIEDLRRVRAACGGALAIVTGRPLDQVDGFLVETFPAAAEHGAVFRTSADGAVRHADLPDAPWHWVREAQAVVARHPGVILEPKRHGFVLHYRGAPDAGPALREALETLAAEWPEAFAVQPAKMAWELRPLAISKATAVHILMGEPPFAGRVPVFVGDDVTDEDGMRAARELGGLGFRVEEQFADAAAVRAWIRRLAGASAGDKQWPG